jgi:hypothetical protein
MKTADRAVEICQEAARAGKHFSFCYIGETCLVVVQNPERVFAQGSDLIPCFYVVKIHNGHILSEQFL